MQNEFKLPDTLIKEYKVLGISSNGAINEVHVCDDHQRFVKHSVQWNVNKIKFVPIMTHGCNKFRVFGFEIQ